MERYIIGNDSGQTASILLAHHRQHVWSESHADVSRQTLKRIEHELGSGPYTNPDGNFGRAQRVYLHLKK